LSFASREKGLFQLTVPTGGGKTKASLRFALHHAKKHKMERIIYVVPYTSIIDQNARVAREIFETGNKTGRQIVLEHHSNLTQEKDTWQSKILSQNWDAPIVFTTAVQFLETLFGSGTRGARRMHQLANAVIIFDEIQTIPVKTIHLFNNAINFFVEQCGSTVVLCTATQPLLDKVDAGKGAARLSVDPQMAPDTETIFEELHRATIEDKRKVGGWTDDEIAKAALDEMKASGSALVIVNTKSQAKAIYGICREREKEADIFHLSTSMCPAHRRVVFDKIRKCLDPDTPKPVVCISTQLIEAGVDVDFGSVIRCLAGLDSIAQAAGRCNRNGLRQFGRVLVVNPQNENLDRLPDIRIAKDKAERVLGEYKDDPEAFAHNLQSPAAMDRYYEYYFYSRKSEMDYPVKNKGGQKKYDLLTLLSRNASAVEAFKRKNGKAPAFSLRQSFKSAAEEFKAIDTATEGVIAPYGADGKRIVNEMLSSADPKERHKLLMKAQSFSVNMYPREVEKLDKVRGYYEIWPGSGVYCLYPQYYSDEFGFSVEPVGPMPTLIVSEGNG
jgi:CRISPR-associated endonuclease/helicase Cas3